MRSEDVDAVIDRLGALPPVGDLVAPRQQLAQPGDLLLEGAFAPRRLARLLVAPVRGDAELRLSVHLLGADLHFERSAGRADHRGVERLVEVSLRPRDVVVELLRDRLPQVVHHAERGVAILDRGHDDAQRPHIVELAEVERLGAHLVPDRVDVLRPAVELALYARGLQAIQQRLAGLQRPEQSARSGITLKGHTHQRVDTGFSDFIGFQVYANAGGHVLAQIH